MSVSSKSVLFALSFLLLLPVVAVVAAPPSPTIHNPTISPSRPGAGDQVTVNVTITPSSSVQSVSLYYTIDNWTRTNRTVTASYNSAGQFALAYIPAQSAGTHVEYYIVAMDFNNNLFVNNDGGLYFSYNVLASSSPYNTSFWITTAIVLVAVGVAAVVALSMFRPKTAKSTSDKTRASKL